MKPAEPMLNAVRGNERLRAELLAALSEDRLPHSLLLAGEAGCGAGFAARCLAADYLFPQGGPPAQNTAQGRVTQIDEKGELVTGIIREVLALRPVGKMNQINIAQIRTARRECFQSSLSADGRVVLIQGADRMNQSAANALLKVLEEPPEGVLFLLTAGSQAAVLPTIRSRCSVYAVSPVSPDECTQALLQQEHQLPPCRGRVSGRIVCRADRQLPARPGACAPCRTGKSRCAVRLPGRRQRIRGTGAAGSL